jgi:hypothetical protein
MAFGQIDELTTCGLRNSNALDGLGLVLFGVLFGIRLVGLVAIGVGELYVCHC